ncbi:phage tail protein [Campylobacter sp. RM9334]|uniref:phage late control D family protein n=1 Tax=Campylobacter sp. RM9334 TaxID=2735732 RepID=UPI001D6A738F|nr:phage tail protein [Campylobacter sp. RM9334]
MVATFKLIANDKDITQTIQDNLISLEFSDKVGVQSDEMSFVVNGIFVRPAFSDTLKLSLGYIVNEELKLFECGTFSISECTIDYINNTTEVRATAVNFSSSVKIKHSKTFANTNLGAIAGVIANRNNLTAKVQNTAFNVKINHILQDNSSDIEFIYSLAYKHGFICAIKNNCLILTAKNAEMNGYKVIASKKESKNEDLPSFKLKISDCFALSITENNRIKYDACEITSHNTNSATLTRIKVGDGNNVYKIKESANKSEAELKSIATARLSELNKGGVKGSLICAGQQISAGGYLELENIGVFSITSVNHTLSSDVYSLNVEFEA